MTLFRTHTIKHILNVATGIEIFREDKDIIEKKVELLDVPEQNIDTGGKTFHGYDSITIIYYTGCFLTGTPPKNSKYKQVNLG